MSTETRTVDLPQGTVRYRDFGEGEPIVFVHGFLVDSRLWDGPAERLRSDFRCILPDLPMGAHRTPMNPDADLTPHGFARLLADFLAALELDGVTIVGNDSGGAMSQVLVTRHPERVGRLVLTNCDAFEHFPPGPFKAMPPIAKLPGGMTALSAPFRVGPLARFSYDQFVAGKVPRELVSSWLEPTMSDGAIKRDTQRLLVDMNKRYTLEAAEHFGEIDIPVLLAWGEKDRLFTPKQAKRLAEAIPAARLEWIANAKTFVALDQPQALAEKIAAFIRETAAVGAST
jgi:pimeloyl-ACP methyl ester carboxylesterase